MADQEQGGQEKRRHHRQRVLWNARLCIGDPEDGAGDGGYELACRVLNMSLSGARIQISLPLRDGAEVTLRLPRYGDLPARVAWYRDGYLGLAFRIDESDVLRLIGRDAVERLRLDRAAAPGENAGD